MSHRLPPLPSLVDPPLDLHVHTSCCASKIQHRKHTRRVWTMLYELELRNGFNLCLRWYSWCALWEEPAAWQGQVLIAYSESCYSLLVCLWIQFACRNVAPHLAILISWDEQQFIIDRRKSFSLANKKFVFMVSHTFSWKPCMAAFRYSACVHQQHCALEIVAIL